MTDIPTGKRVNVIYNHRLHCKDKRTKSATSMARWVVKGMLDFVNTSCCL